MDRLKLGWCGLKRKDVEKVYSKNYVTYVVLVLFGQHSFTFPDVDVCVTMN